MSKLKNLESSIRAFESEGFIAAVLIDLKPDAANESWEREYIINDNKAAALVTKDTESQNAVRDKILGKYGSSSIADMWTKVLVGYE